MLTKRTLLRVEQLADRIVPTTTTWYGYYSGHEGEADYAGNWSNGVPQDGYDIYVPYSSPELNLTTISGLDYIGALTIEDNWGGGVLIVPEDFSIHGDSLIYECRIEYEGDLNFGDGTNPSEGEIPEGEEVEFFGGEKVVVKAGRSEIWNGTQKGDVDFIVNGVLSMAAHGATIEATAGEPTVVVNGRLDIRNGTGVDRVVYFVGYNLQINGIGSVYISRNTATAQDDCISLDVNGWVYVGGELYIDSSGYLAAHYNYETGDSNFSEASIHVNGGSVYIFANENQNPNGNIYAEYGYYQNGGTLLIAHDSTSDDVYITADCYLKSVSIDVSSVERAQSEDTAVANDGEGRLTIDGDLTLYSSLVSSCHLSLTFYFSANPANNKGDLLFVAGDLAFTGAGNTKLFLETNGTTQQYAYLPFVHCMGSVSGSGNVESFDEEYHHYWDGDTLYIMWDED